jgi:hypothetical protein
MPFVASASPLTAEIAIGTVRMDCSRRCAVTTISPVSAGLSCEVGMAFCALGVSVAVADPRVASGEGVIAGRESADWAYAATGTVNAALASKAAVNLDVITLSFILRLLTASSECRP